MYSFPLTISSDSVTRSLRSRGWEDKEMTIRSSSLSTHAAAFPAFDCTYSSSDNLVGMKLGKPTVDGAESRKNS